MSGTDQKQSDVVIDVSIFRFSNCKIVRMPCYSFVLPFSFIYRSMNSKYFMLRSIIIHFEVQSKDLVTIWVHLFMRPRIKLK